MANQWQTRMQCSLDLFPSSTLARDCSLQYCSGSLLQGTEMRRQIKGRSR